MCVCVCEMDSELVRKSDERLNAAADFWDCGSLGVPERMEGEVRSVQGQVRLLIRERFGQFLGLVDQCERQIGPKPTTLFDLQGFWEMVLLQVQPIVYTMPIFITAASYCLRFRRCQLSNDIWRPSLLLQ